MVNFRSDLFVFLCYIRSIEKGITAGLISKQSLSTFKLLTHFKDYDNDTKVYYGGKFKKKFFLRIVKEVAIQNWHFMLMHKYEPWEGELKYYFSQLMVN